MSATAQTWDAIVVGAGPAGSSCATALARAGKSVLLVDKATFPRDKCCGDGLTYPALVELEKLEFDPASCPSWQEIVDTELIGPRRRDGGAGRVARARVAGRRGVVAAVVRRIELDAVLVDMARGAGAVVCEGTGVVAVEDSQRACVVTLADGERHAAPVVVAADGARGVVAKLAGIERVGDEDDWLAFRQYVHAAEEGHDGGEAVLRVAFARELLPAYAWRFPLADGTANIGAGAHRFSLGRRGELAGVWRDLVAQSGDHGVLAGEPAGRLQAWPIPTHLDRSVLGQGRVLVVGDAAGVADALSGEGISQALVTGRLAGEAIIAGRSRGEVLVHYERAVHAALDNEARGGARIQRFLSRGWMADLGVWATGLHPVVGSVLVRTMMGAIERRDIAKPWVTLRNPGVCLNGTARAPTDRVKRSETATIHPRTTQHRRLHP